jgi:hypothetical protein
LAGLNPARSPVGRSSEARVAPASPSAPGHHEALARFSQINQKGIGLGVFDRRTQWELYNQVVAGATVLVFPPSKLSPLGPKMLVEMKTVESVFLRGGNKVYITAIASVPAVRSPFGHVLLPPETEATVSAGPGSDLYHGLIYKFH